MARDIAPRALRSKRRWFRGHGGTGRFSAGGIGGSIGRAIDGNFLVRDIEVSTDAAPFAICPAIAPDFAVVKGPRIGPGWKKQLKERLGGVHGCTHHVEMLGAMATVAFQTLWPKRDPEQEKDESQPAKRPAFLDTCHALASDSPVVAKHWPKFYTGKEEKRA